MNRLGGSQSFSAWRYLPTSSQELRPTRGQEGRPEAIGIETIGILYRRGIAPTFFFVSKYVVSQLVRGVLCWQLHSHSFEQVAAVIPLK